MADIKIGEMYAYLTSGGRKADEVNRVVSEEELQEIIREYTDKIFRKKILWISEMKKYGDMFGLGEDSRLVIVEIKGRESRGIKNITYGLNQIRNKFHKIKKIAGSKRRFLDVCVKYGVTNPEKTIKKKLGLDFKRLKRLNLNPEFYLISTQFQKKVIKAAEISRRKRLVKRWRPNIKCINLNVFKRGSKKFLIMTRYL